VLFIELLLLIILLAIVVFYYYYYFDECSCDLVLLGVDNDVSEGAVVLNAQVILVASVLVQAGHNSEEAILAPWLTPAVSDDPVFNSRADINTPASNAHQMILFWIWVVLLIDATGVGHLQGLSSLNTASNWAVLIDLGHHLSTTTQSTIISDHPTSVVLNGKAVTSLRASTALVEGIALLVNGLVVVASLIRNARVVSVLKDTIGPATMASASTGAVEHVLDREVGTWPRAFLLNVDAISQRARGTMSPAASTVNWDVLVSSS